MNSSLPTHQSGAVLLALLLVIVSGSAYLLVSNLNENAKKVVRLQETRNSLELAKSALLGYAVNFPEISGNSQNGPGYLPCPDLDNTGYAGGACSFANGTTVGRLPFETLEIEELRDAHGERFWYAVSDSHKYGTGKTVPLNSNVKADLSVSQAKDVVAVIIAPGEPLYNQERPSNNVLEYLEGENSNKNEEYLLNEDNSNDLVAYITRQELMSVVEERVIGQLELKVESHYSNYDEYPWLSPFADPDTSSFLGLPTNCGGHLSQELIDTMPEWFSVNEWHHLIVMIYTDEYSPDMLIGCSPSRTDLTVFYSKNNDELTPSPGAILIMSGIEIEDQDRSSSPTIDDYFECENKTFDDTYRDKKCSNNFNDNVRNITP